MPYWHIFFKIIKVFTELGLPHIHPENKIVVRFWIVSIILAVLTIVTLKIR